MPKLFLNKKPFFLKMDVNNHWIVQSIQKDLFKILEPIVSSQSKISFNVGMIANKMQVCVESEEKYFDRMKDAIVKAYQSHFFASHADLKLDEKNLIFLNFVDHCMIMCDEDTKITIISQFGPATLEISFADIRAESDAPPETTISSSIDIQNLTVNSIDELAEQIFGIKRVLDYKFVSDGSLRVYNQFISIGSWCIGANYLKMRKWASKTYPFDWTFSNLNAVIYSVANPMFPLDELKKKQDDRRRFSESDVQQVLGFPHQESSNMEENLAAMERRCLRWKTIVNQNVESNGNGERQLIALVHFARPSEKYLKVLNCLKRLLRQLRNYNSKFDFEIISVWHRVWNERDEANHQKINKVFYLGHASTTLPSSNSSNRIHIYLARVSNEWDGNNWSGRMQHSLLDEIFNQFTFKPIE